MAAAEPLAHLPMALSASPPELDSRTPELLRALGHPLRLQLMQLIAARGPLCGCHIEEELPHPQPLISKHLVHLRRAGLLDSRREGRWTYYSANPAALELLGEGILAIATTARTPHLPDHCD